MISMQEKSKRVFVVGGGPAGMMAAIQSASCGCDVTIVEKNEKLGKKLFITGKGRCNLTNACDISDLFSNVISNPKFLYSAFYSFTNEQVVDFFNKHGLPTKVERGKRVFPASDKSSDVIRTLEKECKRLGVAVLLHTEVKKLQIKESEVTGVVLKNQHTLPADKVIVATGGCSYVSTGSTGDGYEFAKEAGHTVTAIRPGLTGIVTADNIGKQLQGLTLKNCREVLFTHYGVSGPLMLSASSIVGDKLQKEPLILHIDLKPALSMEQLDKRIVKDFSERMNLSLKNACRNLLPASMVTEVLSRAGLDVDSKVNQLDKKNRLKLVDSIKDFTVTLKGLRDINEAIITRGGVKVSEIDPSTMESKQIQGLFFAGEVLDLDALTGGFNLQIAWSTGYLAGREESN